MKAVRIHKPEGLEGIEGLVYEDAPDPQPAIGDALVQVRAASFTPTELTWPLQTDRAGHDRGPRIPAHEGSGVVVELGYGSAGVSVGDEVYGLIDGYRDGWAAEYVAIEARSLAPKPTTVDFVEAAAIPQAGLTSWQALFDHGHLESDQTVVIHGAGGGVGSIGVELARGAGAHVIGTGRAGARERVLELGADDFVDLEQGGWETAVGQVDLVYDAIGGDVLARSAAIVKPGGALVTIMAPLQTERDDIRVVHFVRDPSGAQLRDITRLVDQGKLRPQVGAVYSLTDAREAFMAKSTQHIPGKVVLTP
ncbi:MAG: NADP-dependent oxidoreductase [Solirubrobacterales bacterium]|nr:NADP-dependent oxidoreductase [Solirubrobacterales bacterium]MBV9805802.1 NADP-dependent oxidoreductase [Solirubrobacterales bacterium]